MSWNIRALIEAALTTQPPLRRSLFTTPASSLPMLMKAHTRGADILTIDLEDGVAADAKSVARLNAQTYLTSPQLHTAKSSGQIKEIAIRINAITTSLGMEDLKTLIQPQYADTISVIIVPKTESESEIRKTLRHLMRTPGLDHIRLFACCESARSLSNLHRILTVDRRVEGVIFGSEDFCADTGITRTDGMQELLYARSKIIQVAKTYKKQVFDLVTIAYGDLDRCRHESADGARMGFDGKQVIHPAQIPIVNELFMPSDDEITFARQVLKGYMEYAEKGVGVFAVQGKVIDLPMLKQALNKLVLIGDITQTKRPF
jgi:citrate lyase subunit beta-like protein